MSSTLLFNEFSGRLEEIWGTIYLLGLPAQVFPHNDLCLYSLR